MIVLRAVHIGRTLYGRYFCWKKLLLAKALGSPNLSGSGKNLSWSFCATELMRFCGCDYWRMADPSVGGRTGVVTEELVRQLGGA